MWILGLKGLICKRLFRALDKMSLFLKINVLISWFCGLFLVQKRGGKSFGHLPRVGGGGVGTSLLKANSDFLG